MSSSEPGGEDHVDALLTAPRALAAWFTNPKGPNQLFELWIHPVAYGLFLVPFFLGIRHAALTEPAASRSTPAPPA